MQRFSELYSRNGRIVVPLERLDSLAAMDTSFDLEIVGSGKKGHALGVLLEFYAPQKIAYVQSCCGEVIQTTVGKLVEECGELGGDIFVPCESGFCLERYGFCDLVRIIRRLTASDGCPWDRVQTHESIAGNMIEEAYEAASAALSGNLAELREELGDVLLQPVLNCDIAERSGEFSLGDCIDELCKKLYSRHTHIFGTDKAADEGDALGYWEKAKEKEKSYSGAAMRIKKLPDHLPALMRAQKTIKAILKEQPTDQATLLAALKSQLESISAGKSLEESNILLLTTALFALQKIDAETTLLKQTNKLATSTKEGIYG